MRNVIRNAEELIHSFYQIHILTMQNMPSAKETVIISSIQPIASTTKNKECSASSIVLETFANQMQEVLLNVDKVLQSSMFIIFIESSINIKINHWSSLHL
jgi:hypothetical protein